MWFLLLVSCGASTLAPPGGLERSEQPVQGALRVASWNVEWLANAPGTGRRPRSAADLREMAALVSEVNADVWAFEEVAGEPAVRHLLGADWQVHVESRVADQRVAIAVRPGLDVVFDEVPAIAVGHSGLRYGVEADVAGVHVLALHLKAGCQWDPLEGSGDCQVLAQQAAAVEEWVDAQARAGAPFVVLGDWNRQLTPDDAVWSLLNDGEPVGLVLRGGALGGSDDCPGSRHRHPIDHVVAGGAAAAWLSDSRQLPHHGLSDHCPVVADLRRAP